MKSVHESATYSRICVWKTAETKKKHHALRYGGFKHSLLATYNSYNNNSNKNLIIGLKPYSLLISQITKNSRQY